MTPEEINACKPDDRVRLDGLVLTLSQNGWWMTENQFVFRTAAFTGPFGHILPGVTITKLEDPDLLLAREYAARFGELGGLTMYAENARLGRHDDSAGVQAAILAIKAARGEKP